MLSRLNVMIFYFEGRRVSQLCVGAKWVSVAQVHLRPTVEVGAAGAVSDPKRTVKAEELFQECVAPIREKLFLICRNSRRGDTVRKCSSNKMSF